MRTMSSELQAHYALGTTTIATCWKVTRTDGVVLYATTHDDNIVFDGHTYLSVTAFTPSDIENNSGMNPDNLEVEGFLLSPAVTTDDIHSGVWDFAAVEVFEVNYADTTMGRNLIRVGTMGELRGQRAKFNAEQRGLTQAYSRRIVELVTQDCRADFGDTRCGVSLASYTFFGVVEAVTDNRVITCTTLPADPTGLHYLNGKVTFNDGLNVGLSMEVGLSAAGPVIHCWTEFPFEIMVGDNFSISWGCQKRYEEDCITTFNNGDRFRGFPHLPGPFVYAVGGGGGARFPSSAPPGLGTPGAGPGGPTTPDPTTPAPGDWHDPTGP